MVTNIFGISRRVIIHRFSRDFSFDLFSFHQEKKKRTQPPLVVISPLSNVINEKSKPIQLIGSVHHSRRTDSTSSITSRVSPPPPSTPVMGLCV